MSCKNLILISLLLAILVLCGGAVSASQDNLTTDELAVNEDIDIETSDYEVDNELNDGDNRVGYNNPEFCGGDGGIEPKSLSNENIASINGTFVELNELIQNASENSVIKLDKDYVFDNATDSDFKDGINIKSLTIDGQGHTINANSEGRIFEITGKNVIIKNITFTGGHAYDGGAIYNKGYNCTINFCSFYNCSARSQGGAILNSGVNCTINSCSFYNCSTDYYSNLYIDGGGAIYNYHGDNCIINSCDFINCSSEKYGGAIYNYFGVNCIINSCDFINCSASDGGAIYNYGRTPNVSSCTFIYCSASDGGAIYNNGNNGTINSCSFYNCSARNDGGAIHNSGMNCTINSCDFINCSAYDGGAIYNYGRNPNDGVNCIVGSCDFINCSASGGGAIYNYYGDNCSVISCSFYNCSADSNYYYNGGGAIYNYGDNCSVSSCIFNNCSARSQGGAIYNYGYNCNLWNSKFINNSASRGANFYTRYSINEYNNTYIDLYIPEGTFTALQKMIDEADENSTIILENDYTYNKGFMTSGIVIDKTITINGNGHTINANSEGSIFYINGKNVIIKNITFIGGYADYGGAIYNYYDVNCIINSCDFINCSARYYGGAIYNSGYNCTLWNSKFINNSASRGANFYTRYSINEYNNTYIDLYIPEGTFTALQKMIDEADENSTIILENDYTYNKGFMEDGIVIDKTITIDGNGYSINANSEGSIFYITGKNVIIKNITFTSGSYDGYGGAIYNYYGDNCIITSCDFINCSASDGGAIYNYYGVNCSIISCDFINCSASDGGAIYNYYGVNCSISFCDFINCSARYYGGAIYNTGMNCTLFNTKFKNNHASGKYDNFYSEYFIKKYNTTYIDSYIYGGKFFSALQKMIDEATDGSTIILDNDYTYDDGFNTEGITISKSLTIDGNGHTINANSEGSIFYITGSNILIKNITFIEGYAYNNGGAIYNNGVNCSIISCDFINCSARGYGGAIYNLGVNCNLWNSKFINNAASRYANFYTRYSINEYNNTYIDSYIPEGTFTALQKMIDDAEENSTIILENDYTYNKGFMEDGIVIDKTITIDGNGHTINANSEGSIFYITGSNILIKNITFIEGDVYNNGVNCSIISCDFINCSARGNGGAIRNSGVNCTINSCDFINCSARYDGGAILNSGVNCTINSCDFINCSAIDYGGAIYNYGYIRNSGVNCTINSCSFYNCSAKEGGAIYNYYGNNCTINSCDFINCSAYLGGAIYNTGMNCTLCNTKFKNNHASGKYDNFYSKYFIKKYNTIYIDSYIYGGKFFSALQKMIDEATDGSTIILDNDYIYDDGFNTEGITISKSLTIDGNGHSINANSEGSIFYITGSNILIKNITFIEGYAYNDGGVIYNNGVNCSISSCTFINCSAYYGGAICNRGVNCSVGSCTFINCSARYYGGAFCNWAVNCSVGYCTFINCSADDDGGAISNWDGVNCTINSCDFINCSAYDGGAISNYYGVNCSVGYCTFINCSAYDGGAIYNSGDNCSVGYCTFINCSSSENGGAIFFKDSGNVLNCTFVNNIARNDGVGGAIYIEDLGDIINCTFVNNSACIGGAVCFVAGNVFNCTFVNNIAHNVEFGGGAILIGDYGNVSYCTFVNNSANTKGGAILNGGYLNVTKSSFINNTSDKGGAISSYNITFGITLIRDSTFINNGNNTIMGKTNLCNSTIIENNINVTNKYPNTNSDNSGSDVNNISGNDSSQNTTGNNTNNTNTDINNTNTNTPTQNNQNNQQTTIKKQTPKITAKKKTFKAKKKSKKYTITLKVGKKAVKKVWVTLKIKGKTIKAKTNNKGQAVFKITLKKKGTYKAKISFKGDKNYKAVSKKVTIKIK